jgi:hypothetical protein
MKYSAAFYSLTILIVMLMPDISRPLTIINYLRKKNFEKRAVMRGLTLLAIEKALSKLGARVRDNIANELYNKYNCYFPDCYDHPEYLEDVLRSTLGNSLGFVAQTIVSELIEINHDDGMRALIGRIACHSYQTK